MSLEYRKNQAKEKSSEIYTQLHANSFFINGVNSFSYTQIDKINYHLSQVLKILKKEV